ncbi:MAG: hypothetical protein V1848_03260 [Candidatus Magasanikbacteria bacterium]
MHIFRELLRIFFLPILLFIFNLIVDVGFHIYNLFPFFDIPMHFLGGLFIGISGWRGLQVLEKKKYIKVKQFVLSWIIIVCFVGTIAVLWEFYEYIWDVIFPTQFQAGLKDTMGDLFFGLLGGIFSVLFRKK